MRKELARALGYLTRWSRGRPRPTALAPTSALLLVLVVLGAAQTSTAYADSEASSTVVRVLASSDGDRSRLLDHWRQWRERRLRRAFPRAGATPSVSPPSPTALAPAAEPTPLASPTRTPTAGAASAVATGDPTATPTPTATAAPISSPTPTATPVATAGPTTAALPTASPTVAVTATATPSSTPTATPVPVATSAVSTSRFVTLPPFAQLASGAECAGRVRRSGFEPRPQNRAANEFSGLTQPVSIQAVSADYNAKIAGRIDGAFSGTTDEIIQWASCKWGFDEDTTRARAVVESWWVQSTGGDVTSSADTCAQIGKPAPCAESYGLLQIRFPYNPGTYPRSEQSTAFNVDYALAWMRACYEGDLTWLGGAYAAGDERGCIGTWFAGNWYSDAAQGYIGRVEGERANRTWERPGF